MNIIQIIPGSGGSFYCGNCLRDSKFYDSMRALNHKVVKIPMYLPLFSDEHDLSEIPVFYGAVSLYLKQQYPIFRKMPKWFFRFLDSPFILKFAAHMAGSTNAKGLENMTISMLLGEQGNQADDLEKMVDWIAEHCNPDVIHLSNALLLGLAKRVKERLNVPVVCSLQDEDVWIDAMDDDFREKVWNLIRKRSNDIDMFVAVSKYYGDRMQKVLNIPDDKLSTIHLGIDFDYYRVIPPENKPRRIGYISRLNHENGCDIVIDAFIKLSGDIDFDDVELWLTGGYTGDDLQFLKEQKRKIKHAGLDHRITIFDEYEGEARMKFFDGVSLITVPVRNGEAFGIYLLEAMACGIPVVQPNLGAFPEILNISSGGTIYDSSNIVNLVIEWKDLLQNSNRLKVMSANAQSAVIKHFSIAAKAHELISVYKKVSD